MDWIFQVPEQVTLSSRHLLFQTFWKQCDEPHLQLLVQYLEKKKREENEMV